MNKPIKLKSNRVYRPFIGGKLLEIWQGDKNPKDGHYGERWLASLINASSVGEEKNEGLSYVYDSQYTLKELIEKDPISYLGETHYKKYGINLAFLVKALDSYSRLLIQVHPNKEQAQNLFNSSFGKTESWYILETREVNGEKPYILFGFKKGITKEKLMQAFHEQNIVEIENMMHKFYVKPGDLFFIEGGIPHAIGSGCFLIEIQEPTDYTIRLEKTAPDGRIIDDNACHQGLGFEKMFDCFNYTGYTREEIESKWKVKPYVKYESSDIKIESLMNDEITNLFEMEKYTIKSNYVLSIDNRFGVALVIKGEGKIIVEDNIIDINKGDEIFIPYDINKLMVENKGNSELELIMCYPPKSTN